MRWETISTNSSNEIYQLKHQGKQLLTLVLHPFSNSARIECEDEKRVFLIRKEGFRRNKTVLRNEYGIKIGELGFENKEHFIEINSERFYYVFDQQPSSQLIIYKETKEKPFMVCELGTTGENPSVQLKEKKSLASHTSLLMALCWYMFLPVADKMSTEVMA